MTPSRSKLRPGDVLSLGTLGLRTRKGRTAMASIGIAIGVASLIALVGIINSGEADAQRDLLEQGIDVLELTPGTSFAEDPELLPDAAAAIDTHMKEVSVVASIRRVPATLRKTDLIPEVETGGIRIFAVEADDLDLLIPLRGGVATGRFHDAATLQVPTVVLGADTAEVLGFDELRAKPTVHISGHDFAVIGVLEPFTISQGLTLNRSALIGFPVAEELYDADPNPERIWVQAPLDLIEKVRELLPRQANPEAPGEVAVSSLDLDAREIISENFESLLRLLVVVIIVVGAIGVGNIMFISVLERRGGNRGAPGAGGQEDSHRSSVPHRIDSSDRSRGAGRDYAWPGRGGRGYPGARLADDIGAGLHRHRLGRDRGCGAGVGPLPVVAGLPDGPGRSGPPRGLVSVLAAA